MHSYMSEYPSTTHWFLKLTGINKHIIDVVGRARDSVTTQNINIEHKYNTKQDNTLVVFSELGYCSLVHDSLTAPNISHVITY